jgi:chorismate synthase
VNAFGKLFRVQILGESHGEGVGVLLDGVPAGLAISPDVFTVDMQRRRGGLQAGTTPRKEEDVPVFKTGVFNGKTTGAPLLIFFENANTRSEDYEKLRATPRPGHADFVATQKFGGFEDYRGGGHFSGRLTAGLVAAGVVAKMLVGNMTVQATLLEVGGEKELEKGITKAVEKKDSIGGIIECCVKGLPIGLGEPFFDSVESLIAHAIFAIPAIRGIEFGTGFAAAKMWGSEHNDPIVSTSGKTATNHAGGVTGGLTNGNDLIFRVAVKPTSSTPQPQESLNITTGKTALFSVQGRHDLCIALRVPVVVEAVTALVLVDLLLQEQKIKRVVS